MSTPYHSAPDGTGPVIVEGNVVSDVKLQSAQIYNHQNSETYSKPSAPPRACRDVFWGVLFYAHLIGMIAAAAIYGPVVAADAQEAVNNYNGGDGGGGGERMLFSVVSRVLDEDGGDDGGENGGYDVSDMDLEIDPSAVAVIVAIATVFALVLSTIALGFMMSFAEALIKIALIFNIVVYGIMGIFTLLQGVMPMGLVLLGLCAFSAYYAYKVWSRIPFAAANLVTAVTAVKCNLGLAFYSYWSVLIMFLWMILWGISSSSVVYVLGECQGGQCQNQVGGVLAFLFLVSLYWTIQVISNVVHVSVAGTVGTWWFSPVAANGCCSRAVRDSYIRSLTTSFGSICFGSLIVALIQATREIVRQAQESGDAGMLLCCIQCLLGCIESLVEYFNKWAYVYVGLYGFSFMEAGKNVITLFKARGWTSIIADVMIDTVLWMVSLGVGLIVGILAMIVGAAVGSSNGATLGVGFILGFVVGYAICSTLFSVVSSAVNTVIVCYAEAPNEFEQNHPQLSADMRSAWRQAWPTDFSY